MWVSWKVKRVAWERLVMVFGFCRVLQSSRRQLARNWIPQHLTRIFSDLNVVRKVDCEQWSPEPSDQHRDLERDQLGGVGQPCGGKRVPCSCQHQSQKTFLCLNVANKSIEDQIVWGYKFQRHDIACWHFSELCALRELPWVSLSSIDYVELIWSECDSILSGFPTHFIFTHKRIVEPDQMLSIQHIRKFQERWAFIVKPLRLYFQPSLALQN